MAVLLSDPSVTSDTPGVLVKGTVDPGFNSFSIYVVQGNLDVNRISDQIDSSYIVNNDEAYWTGLALYNSGTLQINLASSADESGSTAGPQFTENAEDDIYIILFYGSNSAAWDFSELDDSDEDEPYLFSSTSVAAAGPANTSTFATLFVPTAPSSQCWSIPAMQDRHCHPQHRRPEHRPHRHNGGPTSPVDGSATQTVSGTFADDDGNDTATITIAASLGTLGAVTQDDAAGTWEADYTAPASTTAEQTDTLTVTATDDADATATASQNVTIRVTDLMPSLPTIFSQTATVGTAFSLTFDAATGGDPPLTYSLSGNPDWLTLSGLTLSGTPDATGSHQVRVTVEDNDGDTAFRAFILSVSAAAVTLALDDFDIPTGMKRRTPR